MGLYETIQYEVEEKVKSPHIEIRKYPDFYMATAKTPIDPSMSGGFNQVFNYISGGNENNEKISMTTPVISLMDDTTLNTSFVLPKKYQKKDIPTPKSSNISIEKIEAGYFIAIKFKGRWTKDNFNKYNHLLLDYIKENKLEIISKQYILRYQPPFIPSFLRRNEIMYRIKK